MGNELHLDEFVIKNHKVTEEGVFAYLVSAVMYVIWIISFVISVLASIAAHYICKWLDGDDRSNYPATTRRKRGDPRERAQLPRGSFFVTWKVSFWWQYTTLY